MSRTPVILKPVVLSLCDYTGAWCAPYRDGYDVRQIDLKLGTDVRTYEPPRTRRVHGVLAAPPCTVFASSGARWHRTDEEMREALEIVAACTRIVAACDPEWWCIENPVGNLTRWLGKPRHIFQPCDYGDPWTKRTCLWGRFNPPQPTPVEPTLGSRMWAEYGGGPEQRRADRSATPRGFARAFHLANP